MTLLAPSGRVVKLWHGRLKEIHLQSGSTDQLEDQFFIGYGDTDDPLGSRISISWRRSKRHARIERALAMAIRQESPALDGVRITDLVEGISTTIRDNALNRAVVRALFADASPCTLHAAYADYQPEEVIEVLWARLARHLSAEFDSWLFVYPLERVTTKTTLFPGGTVCLLSPADYQTYWKYCHKFPGLRSLDLATGKLRSDMSLTEATTLSWLLVEGYGTGGSMLDWCKHQASFYVGMLLSAVRIEPNHQAFVASAAEPNSFATVISAGNAQHSFKGADCGPILHSVIGTLEIPRSALDVATCWLNGRLTATPTLRKRAETAARWINQAALHREHVRFLFFFFAVDALFGVRYEVERSIVNGVTSIMPGDWGQRCEWLFELRSELVHGGSAAVNEWSRYERYGSHFGSEPESDIEEIATACLMGIFSSNSI